MIRRLVTMSESVDVKAGIEHVLKRIEMATKNRPEQVKMRKFKIYFLTFLSM